EPRPARPEGPPIWIGSWGSEAGLRRVARLGDAWLASAYNTTPDLMRVGRESLRSLLEKAGREANQFPVALATMWTYVTRDKAAARRALEGLARMLNRSDEVLAEQVLIGG